MVELQLLAPTSPAPAQFPVNQPRAILPDDAGSASSLTENSKFSSPPSRRGWLCCFTGQAEGAEKKLGQVM
jgi:hypothetical protein